MLLFDILVSQKGIYCIRITSWFLSSLPLWTATQLSCIPLSNDHTPLHLNTSNYSVGWPADKLAITTGNFNVELLKKKKKCFWCLKPQKMKAKPNSFCALVVKQTQNYSNCYFGNISLNEKERKSLLLNLKNKAVNLTWISKPRKLLT